jgi:proline iminopeptidase
MDCRRPGVRTVHPEIGPYEHGTLDVGDGQRIYWEFCGNPDGKPGMII